MNREGTGFPRVGEKAFSTVRFDDSLRTVLAADDTTPAGAEAAFRQIVDLVARGRAAADDRVMDRLRALRPRVSPHVRAASARSLAFAVPPAALVAFFTEDDAAVAAPVLRVARLSPAAWMRILPGLGPTGRAVLRHRRDLDPAVTRALAAFGTADFVLTDGRADEAVDPAPAAPATRVGFEIADLVARLAAYRARHSAAAPVAPAAVAATHFRWTAEPDGTIAWVEGVPRVPIAGLSLRGGAGAPVDGAVSGAFRRRDAFADGRLEVPGESESGGGWRISGAPAFDRGTGRFTGYRGVARRPRTDEMARPPRLDTATDALRRLVHELRTPANAIVGFAELIESELFGPVDPVHRRRAATIQAQATDLVAAIDDLDMAARIESDALNLRAADVPIAAMLEATVADLRELAAIRGCTVDLHAVPAEAAVAGDDRAVERLLARLLAAIVSAGSPGETIAIATRFDRDAMLSVVVDRPVALATLGEGTLLSIDAEREAEAPGAPLLGTGFALRLAQKLSVELGGTLAIGDAHLTLRLPASFLSTKGQATAS